jgi:hypothetical protein
MSDNSKIEWTDATWNPVRGCTKISAGCLHCYAETFAERFRGVSIGMPVYLAPFSIRKKSNIYGLIFGSQHPLGIHKFLQVAWANDKIAGEANFDIERENIGPSEGILPFEMMRPNKTRAFEKDLEETLRNRIIKTEADVVRFCIEAGMTCQHSSSVLKRLKAEKVIDINFWVPDVRNLKTPRPIRMV